MSDGKAECGLESVASPAADSNLETSEFLRVAIGLIPSHEWASRKLGFCVAAWSCQVMALEVAWSPSGLPKVVPIALYELSQEAATRPRYQCDNKA